jgi:hypothetical protein
MKWAKHIARMGEMRKVKVTFSLCLIKHHSYKTYWSRGGVVPRILDPGTRWRWVVNFTSGRFTPRESASGTHWIGGWVGPTAGLDTVVSKKVKLSLCFNWATRHEGVLGEWRYSSTLSLTSALDGGEWSASRPGRFTPRERAPGTHLIGGWAGPRAVLDAMVKRKIPCPSRKSNPRTPIVQPVAQRYTDWAITALLDTGGKRKIPRPSWESNPRNPVVTYNILVSNPVGKRQLGRSRRRKYYNGF